MTESSGPAGDGATAAVTEPNKRFCYCKPGETTCGTCERCGAPGHTRHSPGEMPYTGAWCDRCYRILGWQYFFLKRIMPLILLVGVIILLRMFAT